ncbi:ribonuclease H-like domain-containing protein [Tanacetum coccineum]
MLSTLEVQGLAFLEVTVAKASATPRAINVLIAASVIRVVAVAVAAVVLVLIPNDDERVDPNLNCDSKKSQSASSSSSESGGISVTTDFLINLGNDADSSDNNFATQNEEVITLEENVFSKGNMDQNPNIVKYGIEKYVGYSKLNYENYCFITQLNKHFELKSFSEASKFPYWIDAMNQEMNALLRNATWEIVDLPKGRKAIGSDLDEDVYMRPPEGYFPSGNKIQSKSDYYLFTKTDKGVFLALLVYVDDIIITGNNVAEIENFKVFLKSMFMIKDLGKLKYFLGIKVLDTDKGICLNQRKYVLDLLSEYGMLSCKPIDTPLLSKLVISNEATTCDPVLENITDYQKLMGKLIYLTNTRPDILYDVHCLSQFMHSPLKSHLKTAFKILRYLKGCPGLGIHFCQDFCKKQNTLSKSSTEAEYRALASVTSEIAANLVFQERTKHLEIDWHFVREKILKVVVKTVKVDSTNQIADIFTKGFGFYTSSCPKAEKIVQDYVNKHIPNAPSLAAALIRMNFHDCFVRGCDASILLNFTSASGNQTEKVAIPNQTVRGFGFIDAIKSLVEAECPGVVSCANIIALASRDSIVATGGPSWKVPTGRRDGLFSNASEALAQIPAPFDNITVLIQKFANKSLDVKDLVLLSGAHTIGISHCPSFSNRLYNFTGVGDRDPSLDSEYADNLR